MPRMLSCLIVPGVSLALASACAPSITVERTRVRFVAAVEPIKQIPIGLVAVAPLPPTYPAEAKPNKFSAEVFDLPDTNHLLIPANHVTVVNETVLLALQYAGLDVKLYPTLTQAARAGSVIVVVPAIARLEVKAGPANEPWTALWTPRANARWVPTASWTPAKATASLSVVIVDMRKGVVRWTGTLAATTEHNALQPGNLTSSDLRAPHVMVETTFQPLRALLVQSVFEVAEQLVERLNALPGL